MPKKLVYGYGVNDSLTPVIKQEKIDGKWKVVWRCKIYKMWHSLLERIYSKKFKSKNQSYDNCTIDVQWHTFSKFKKWVETKDWENKDLDKDLKIMGNKHYSESTCLFIPHNLNMFLTKSDRSRGDNPIGVSFRSNVNTDKPYESYISFNQKKINLGIYKTKEEAHQMWQKEKIKQYNVFINQISDQEIVNCLIKNRDIIQFELDNGIETK